MPVSKKSKILIIVESPNKVKTITGILKKAGYTNARVMASVGHIIKLADDKTSWKNSGVWPEQDFKLNLQVVVDKEKIVSDLATQAAIADHIFIASDGDREGEVIAWSLINFVKPDPVKCFRMIMHEITPKAVVHALENPVEFDDNLVSAGLLRLAIDKLLGWGLSPILRLYLKAKSIGRCQAAALLLLAQREQEITNFISEKYYDLYLNFEKNSNPYKAKYIGTKTNPIDHLRSKNEVIAVANECTSDYKVSSINRRIKKEGSKPPFTTATFQQEVASKLGLSVESAQSCAQELYTGIDVAGVHVGLITYIRTDSTDMSPEFIPDLKNYVESVYGAGSFNQPKTGKKDDSAQEGHECLRCTDPFMTPEKLANYVKKDLLLKVYKIIWQRTIASAMPDAQLSETTYTINNGEHLFNLISNEVVTLGYRAVYGYKDEDDDDEQTLTNTFTKGEVLNNCQLDGVEKATKPKARYKEATFIKELQADGIGRPSTFASILKTIEDPGRGYCTLINKELVPTKLGLQVVEYLSRAFPAIVNINYTRDMEKKLDLVAAGKLDWKIELKKFFDDLVNAIDSNVEVAPQAAKVCPDCGSQMVTRRNKWGKLFLGCSNYPNCKKIINI